MISPDIQEHLTPIKGIDIWKKIEAVKNKNNALLSEGTKRYISIEDARAFIFWFDHEIKRRANEGAFTVGWVSPDLQYVHRIINESIHDAYKKLEDK